MRASVKAAATGGRHSLLPPAPTLRVGPPKDQGLTADALIIGLVGPIGSGCTFLADGLKQLLGERVHHCKLSDVLHELATKRGYSDPVPTSVLQDIGNELRRKEGVGVLAQRWHEATNRAIIEGRMHWQPAGPASDTVDTTWEPGHIILVDGIRNEGEVRYLRSFNNFFLLSVFAHRETRRQRLVGKGAGKKFKTDDDFYAADARDQNEDLSFGQQVTECNYRADLILDNDETFPERARASQARTLCTHILNDYIALIERATSPDEIVERPPTVNETLMTAAYAISKRSSCLKRQVGAVLAFVPAHKSPKAKTAELQFQIVACGYNEVPEGNRPCVFSAEERCYREFLQDQHAELWKNCPNCGTRIAVKTKCPECGKRVLTRSRKCTTQTCKRVPLFDYTCPECKQRVFMQFLTGGKRTPTRMLDMCKALHAEEQTLLAVPPVYKDKAKGELVLYTTTFPCNLCANKIVASRVNRVVFSEPYPMQEAQRILCEGDVTVEQFQGIKSRAYFRLFR